MKRPGRNFLVTQWSGVPLLAFIFLLLFGGTPPGWAASDGAPTENPAEQGSATTGKCICSTPQVRVDQDIAEIRKAAEQGSAEAQRKLGLKYDNGNGVPQDDQQAVAWYRKAAEQGDTMAQWFLGGMYDEGKGVALDEKQALFWYGKAAEQGSRHAQCRLGEIFAEGHAVRQSDLVAYAWYSLAAAQGEEVAARKRDLIAARFSPDQLTKARDLAAELQTKMVRK